MNSGTKKPVLLGLFLGLAWIGGCSFAGATGLVTGEVTLDQKPLKEGVIRFVPVDGKSPTADALIANGRFTATVPTGEMRVEISAPKVVGKRKMYDTPESPLVDEVAELLPPRYNVQSQLTLSVQPGTQEKRFDLKSKGG
jgi:hypothetical protein